ncbi:MAG: hypothetical protein J5515_02075 [Lachnospiraceae bacterium]|nr:hypothetical protein [Lachnospiraceae bacterium]
MQLTDISNNDNIIESVEILENCAMIGIEMWNGKRVQIECKDYLGLKEKACINREIGDIVISEKSDFLNEIDEDMLKGDGSGKELEGMKVVQLFDEWNDTFIIEIIAKEITVKSEMNS